MREPGPETGVRSEWINQRGSGDVQSGLWSGEGVESASDGAKVHH